MWRVGCLGLCLLLSAAACSGGVAAPPAPGAPPTNEPSPAAANAANPYRPAPGEPPVAVRVATCALSGGFVHLYTALEAGVFPRYGLAVEHVLVRGSGNALAALSVGEIQFLYCAADATLPGLASGSDAKIVAAPLVGQPYVLIARPEITSVADLRGKTISPGRPGGLPYRLTYLMLQRHGLRPGEDVQLRPIGVGSQPENFQAVVAGIVDATAITPPLDAQARREGLNVIYYMSDLGLPSIYSALHTSGQMVRSQPRTVQRFVAALADDVHYTEQHPGVARQVLRKVLELEESDALEAAYEAYARRHVNRSLAVPLDAVRAGIEEAREQGTQIAVRGAEDIATNQFAADLERTGFLRALWGTTGPPP